MSALQKRTLNGTHLLIVQCMDGVGAGDAQGMAEDRRLGNGEGEQAGRHEVKRAQRNAIGKTMQPVIEIVPGQRPSDNS